MIPKYKECIVTVTIRVDLSTEEIETGDLTMLKKDLESEVSCCWHSATVDDVNFVKVVGKKAAPRKTINERVYCKDCKYLMFSDCYGECSKAYKGIVNPYDSCKRGKRRKNETN